MTIIYYLGCVIIQKGGLVERRERCGKGAGKAGKTTKRIYGGQETVPNIDSDLRTLIEIYVTCKDKTDIDINVAMNKEKDRSFAIERGKLLKQIVHEKFGTLEKTLSTIDNVLEEGKTEILVKDDFDYLSESLTELIKNIQVYKLFLPKEHSHIAESYFYDIRTNYLAALDKMLSITEKILLEKYTK